jgi:hypothetical protein
MSDQMRKIVEALEIGADAVHSELVQAKDAYRSQPHQYAHLEEEVKTIEEALTAARAMRDTNPLTWSETDISAMRIAHGERFNEPQPRTETLIAVAAVGYRKAISESIPAPPPPAALCPRKDRPATECPGEWEQGCDLGANAEHARRVPEISEVNAESSRFANGDREVNVAIAAQRGES